RRGAGDVRRRDRADRGDGPHILAGQRHHGGGDGGGHPGDDHRGGDRDGRDAGVRRAARPLRAGAPHGADARAVVPPADRHDARGGSVRGARFQGVHLLRDGLLGVRGGAEPALLQEGQGGGPGRRL
ncbi:MAG: Integral membrane protein TerC, partial [uncultured Gemmatimonadetes bacterium]